MTEVVLNIENNLQVKMIFDAHSTIPPLQLIPVP
jgi:hypothetical protein